MGTIVVQALVSLDGVVQGEAGPDEDPRGGFEHGGWTEEYGSGHGGEDEINQALREWEDNAAALLFGR